MNYKNYNIKQFNGEHPAMYMYIAPFAMNHKVLRQFEGYPIVTDMNYIWFIVFDRNEPIAFASLKKLKCKVKFVNSYVTETYRNQGIHTKLISERLRWCEENNIKFIEIDCLESSLNQYIKLGFKEVKTYVKWHKLVKQL